MHFSLRDLWALRMIALPGAIVQIVIATALGVALAGVWGWSLGGGLVLGLALSVASTVVLLRALEQRDLVQSVEGRIAVAWLIVEDLVMVLVLVLLPALSGLLGDNAPSGLADSSLLVTLAVTLAKVAAFIAFMLVIGVRLLPFLLDQVARTRSRELFTLAVVAVALGIAFGSAEFFGVSFALGAFFAGVVLNESDHSHHALRETQPLQDAFAVLFFVSVGMLFDPAILIREPLQILAVLAIVIIGKSAAALLIVLLLRHSFTTALAIAASLAQIGEFSFILAGLGISLRLIPEEGQHLILAAALISITLNPLLFRLAGAIRK
jgi:CPA2 family monovalent cation:H+ antiporter-2